MNEPPTVTRSTMPEASTSRSSQRYSWYFTDELPQLRVRMSIHALLAIPIRE